MDKSRLREPGVDLLPASRFGTRFISWLPWLVLAVSLAITYLSWNMARRDAAPVSQIIGAAKAS